MKSKILGLLAVGLLAGPMEVPAATILGPVNGVTGISGIVIGASIYDVSFVPGDGLTPAGFSSAYGSTPVLPFSNQSGATQARDVIANLFVAQGVGTLVDTTNEFFFVPWALSGTDVSMAFAGSNSSPPNWNGRGESNVTMSCCNNIVWTTFRLVGTVPEPGTLALLGLGLAGLGLSRRRKAN